MIFNFMKMLDPGSVVRESEFATAANAAGVPDRIRNTYNRVLSGERLAKNQRADFINQSGNIFREAKSRNDETVGNFVSLAKGFGLTEDEVVVKRAIPKQDEGQAPPPEDFQKQITATNPETGETLILVDGEWKKVE